MLTSKTTKQKRKLNLSPQTVRVLSSAGSTDVQAGRDSTNQTHHASCVAEVREPSPPKPDQPPPPPPPPIRRA